MNIKDCVKTENEFLVETECEKNENGAYVFTSANGHESLLLDFFLMDYKNWLEEKGLIKVNTKIL